MKHLLVLNAGSTSLKFAVFVAKKKEAALSGVIQNIGGSSTKNHEQAFKAVLRKLGTTEIGAVAHRYVHGGTLFQKPTLVTSKVLQQLIPLHRLAPLHNPVQYATLLEARRTFARVPHILAFDTAFHSTISFPHNAYALPEKLVKKYSLRVFGFHGLSHQHALNVAATKLKKQAHNLNIISLHLGGGTSLCAIKQGKSFAVSMGMSPLSGAVMMSRAGDIDPGIPFTLMREGRMSPESVEKILNFESGMKALTGTDDLRKVLKKAEAGNDRAVRALALYTVSIQKYLAYYAMLLDRVDALVFTGAIGANRPKVVAEITRPNALRSLKRLTTAADEEAMIAEGAASMVHLS